MGKGLNKGGEGGQDTLVYLWQLTNQLTQLSMDIHTLKGKGMIGKSGSVHCKSHTLIPISAQSASYFSFRDAALTLSSSSWRKLSCRGHSIQVT